MPGGRGEQPPRWGGWKQGWGVGGVLVTWLVSVLMCDLRILI